MPYWGVQAVVQVGLVTGNRTVISDATTGTGPAFVSPIDVVVTPAELFVVEDAFGLAAVVWDQHCFFRPALQAEPWQKALCNLYCKESALSSHL